MSRHMEDIRDMLCEELDRFDGQALNAGNLDTIDKLTHAIKSIDTIIAMQGGGYSRGHYYTNDWNSYGRRRDSMGRYARSYDDGIVEQLKSIMDSATDQHTKRVIDDAIKKMGE